MPALFVMPSAGEGFGIVFIEAPACGKPVIAGDAGSCHFVDFCNALTDSVPVGVTAYGTASGRRDAGADSVVTTIRDAHGSLATIQYVAAGDPRPPNERCERVRWRPDRGAGRLPNDPVVRRRPERPGPAGQGFAEQLRRSSRDAAVAAGGPISWADIADAHRVCCAGVRTIETGAAVRPGAASFT